MIALKLGTRVPSRNINPFQAFVSVNLENLFQAPEARETGLDYYQPFNAYFAGRI